MENIRQILSQLALHLELSIAMCDKIDDHEKRLSKLENSHSALKTRTDGLARQLSEFTYHQASKAYDDRVKGMKGGK